MSHNYTPRVTRDASSTYLLSEQSGLHRCAKCGRGPLGHETARPVRWSIVFWSTLLTLIVYAIAIHKLGVIALLF